MSELLSDIALEQALIGSCLINEGHCRQAVGLINADEFADPLHHRAWARITAEVAAGRVVTPLTFPGLMAGDPGLAELPVGYFKSLARAAPAVPNIVEYARVLRNLAAQRALQAAGEALVNGIALANGAGPSAHEIARSHMECIRAIGDRATRGRFPLIPFAELIPGPGAHYLVKSLIPRVGLTVVWGPPKSGKSFWLFDVMVHVAAGKEFRGRQVRQGIVVYVALEGAEGYGRRAAALRKAYPDTDALPFYLVSQQLDLIHDSSDLIASIRATLGVSQPVAVVLDTLNRSLRGSESKDEDMAAYIRAAGDIREAFQCSVVVVHHSGVDASRPRGHTSLAGAVDAQIAIKRNGDKVVANVEYQKDDRDGASATSIGSRLRVVEIGLDADGAPLTSCVIEPCEMDPAEITLQRKLPDRAKAALDALVALIASAGEALPPASGIPDSVRAVGVDLWREEIRRRGILDTTAKNPREDFRRVKVQLISRHVVAERDGLIWPVKQ